MIDRELKKIDALFTGKKPELDAIINPYTTGDALAEILHNLKHNDIPDKFKQIITHMLDKIGYDYNAPLGLVAFELAQLFDDGKAMNNANPYHNSGHVLEVSICCYLLAHINNLSQPRFKLNKDDIALLIVTALIHDLEHDGSINGSNLFMLEKRSLSFAIELFRKHNVSEENIKATELFVLATDPQGPSQLVSNIDKYHKSGKDTPAIPENMSELSPLLNMPKETQMALILCDADLLPSAAFNIEKTIRQTSRICQEQNQSTDTDNLKKSFVFFSDNILNNGFRSEAGDFFTDNFYRIYNQLICHCV